MDVKLIEGPESFDLPEWRKLLWSDTNRSIFSLPEWNRVWWEEFGGHRRLFTLCFYDPQPVAVTPLMIDDTSEGSRVRFVGGDDLTDYLGPIISDQAKTPAVAEALLIYLRSEVAGWSYFRANCLPVPFGFAEWLIAAADKLKMPFSVEHPELTAVLALPDSFDGYLEGLGQKKRHELRRKIRRFEMQAPEWRLRTSSDETLKEDIKSFVDMHRGSEGLKGKFMLPQRASFFTRVAEEFQSLGLLSLDFLESDEKRLASTFSFKFDGAFYLYNSAYDHDFKAISPGFVLVAKLIERSIESRFARFDFLRGRERYKFDLGAEPLPLNAVRVDRE